MGVTEDVNARSSCRSVSGLPLIYVQETPDGRFLKTTCFWRAIEIREGLKIEFPNQSLPDPYCVDNEDGTFIEPLRENELNALGYKESMTIEELEAESMTRRFIVWNFRGKKKFTASGLGVEGYRAAVDELKAMGFTENDLKYRWENAGNQDHDVKEFAPQESKDARTKTAPERRQSATGKNRRIPRLHPIPKYGVRSYRPATHH